MPTTSLFPTTNVGNGDGDGLEALFLSPVAVRRPPKMVGRSLSELVKGLRKIEEEKLDEEMDIMREMEMEAEGRAPPPKKPKLQVQDSQLFEVEMPLGPDGAGETSEEEVDETEALGRDGLPRKAWKKKGQKRTTRKSYAKPSNKKWEPEQEWKGNEKDETDVVRETQIVGEIPRDDDDALDDGHENEDSEFEGAKDKKKEKGTKKTKSAKKSDKKKPEKKKRMVSVTAHANYRALKIKNKNSKAKGGRFGRRR